jgi:glutamate--cysteine ligase regulatory subunit
MSGGSDVVSKTTIQKSNVELTHSLRTNFIAAKEEDESDTLQPPLTNGARTNGTSHHSTKLPTWTSKEGSKVFVPAIDWSMSGLLEDRGQYDITLKLFYLPGATSKDRASSAHEAIELVLRQLGVETIDLLIVSFPAISFDRDDEPQVDCYGLEKVNGVAKPELQPESMSTVISAWRILEDLKIKGLVARIGVSEFGYKRLAKLVSVSNVRPNVNQINLTDCCEVPRPLVAYAKQEHIELLTHNDCTNILPKGTTRELLGQGPQGAGILNGASSPLHGEILPQWVVKYTAVIRDRGVVENKGYFALADLVDSKE